MATIQNLPLINNNLNGYLSANTAFRKIAALNFGRVVSNSTSVPPGSPSIHSLYILNGTGSGDWTGYNTNDVAYFGDDSTWTRITPNRGLVLTTSDFKQTAWDGSSWVVQVIPTPIVEILLTNSVVTATQASAYNITNFTHHNVAVSNTSVTLFNMLTPSGDFECYVSIKVKGGLNSVQVDGTQISNLTHSPSSVPIRITLFRKSGFLFTFIKNNTL